jgi:hypothetical protein
VDLDNDVWPGRRVRFISTSTGYNVVLIQVRLGVQGQWAVSPIWAVIIIF